MISKVDFYFLKTALPGFWPKDLPARAFQAVGIRAEGHPDPVKLQSALGQLFGQAASVLAGPDRLVTRAFNPGVSHPMAVSLGSVIGLHESHIRVDQIIQWEGQGDLPLALLKQLEWSWREPAIESLRLETFADWKTRNEKPVVVPVRSEDSFDILEALVIGLEFSSDEFAAIADEEHKRGRRLNRAELELVAQTWSEHCKHKIFAAEIYARDVDHEITQGLFKTHIRKPTFEIADRDGPPRLLSVFHDNAGVLALSRSDGSPTDWAIALKAETHNSPSAISPYGGASTGIVGVHRDILGTGLGALPIANWDVLCFESSDHSQPRPEKALPADVVRLGVIKGIEDGGNQSGIPTVQGSVVFDPAFAVKPYVFAGTVGLLPKSAVAKKPRPGLPLYCVGGSVGADGLRGAVMSSRDLRSTDFTGSAVQVANAFVQRRMTDFLMEARDKNLIDVVTDNGAGGLASSCGEMAGLTGGARIDLSQLRLKYEGLLAWERLLSESQERMTLATSRPEEFEALLKTWDIGFDRLGELTDTGRFEVLYDGRSLVDLRLEFLHDGCPQMKLQADWDLAREREGIETRRGSRPSARPDVLRDFPAMLESETLCSRQGVAVRFDHEVQGRSLRKPFQGVQEQSPGDASLIEIPEASSGTSKGIAACVLSHGLAPWRDDIVENVLHSFDEALRSAVLGGIDLKTAGALDNFCWPDPIPALQTPRAGRNLWRLVRANEVLAQFCRAFELPLISGKDSMKNNSRDLDCPATLLISIGGSARNVENIPVGFFSRANEVVFYLPPLKQSLRDSAWERCTGKIVSGAQAMFPGRSPFEISREIEETLHFLQARYASLGSIVREGFVRSAKDISEGGPLMSVFEMCLGRGMGFQFEDEILSPEKFLGEGLGGVVISVDPHFSAEVEKRVPEMRRLGVVLKAPILRWGKSGETPLEPWTRAYLKKSQSGFFG